MYDCRKYFDGQYVMGARLCKYTCNAYILMIYITEIKKKDLTFQSLVYMFLIRTETIVLE